MPKGAKKSAAEGKRPKRKAAGNQKTDKKPKAPKTNHKRSTPLNFRTYIKRLFAEETKKEFKGDLSMSKLAVDVMDSFALDWIERIINMSYDGVRKAKRRTLMIEDVKTTLKDLLRETFDDEGEDDETRKENKSLGYYKTMAADGKKALNNFAKGKEGQTSQDKAGIKFPPARVRRIIKEKDIRVEKLAPLYIAAVVEGIVGTVLLAAGEYAQGKTVTYTLECVKKAKNGKCEKKEQEFTEDKVNRLKPRHILRVSQDKTFSPLFPDEFIVPRYKPKRAAKTGAGKSTTTSKSKKGGKKKQWPKADWGPIADSMEEEDKKEAEAKQPRKSAKNKKSYESNENYYGDEYFSSWF